MKLLRFLFLMFLTLPMMAQDILLEFKGAAFMPTDSCVKAIYGKAAGIYGAEVTFSLSDEDTNWYGFASINFLSKKGYSIGLCDATKMYYMPLGLGLKYLVPFCYGDYYVGLGFQPARLKTVNCSEDVAETTTKWGFGGIAKLGAFFDLPYHFFLDLFVDYSFINMGFDSCLVNVVPLRVRLNGAVLGIGLGHRF